MIGKWLDTEAETVKLQRIADARPGQFVTGCFMDDNGCGCLGGIAEGWATNPQDLGFLYLTPMQEALYGTASEGGYYERLCERYGAVAWDHDPAPPRVVRMLQDRARRALASRALAALSSHESAPDPVCDVEFA